MPVEPSSPASSAASLPAFASDETQTPVSSNRESLMQLDERGLADVAGADQATRMAMTISSQIRDGQVEVGVGEAAVDLERLAGQEAARG